MKRVPAALAALALPALVTALSAAQAARPVATSPRPAASHAPAAPTSAANNETIQTYCVGCHNDRSKSGGLTLATFDVAKADAHALAEGTSVQRKSTRLMARLSRSSSVEASAGDAGGGAVGGGG